MSDYAMFFRQAADRLADSFTGQPFDDTILIPWLYLHRHATELELKNAIVFATRLRRADGDDHVSLGTEETKDRLKRKHGHNLRALLDELDRHLVALDLSVTPTETRKLLGLLAELDHTGESFRYAGSLGKENDRVDFPNLDAALREMGDTLSATLDVLDQYAEYQQDMAAEFADYNAQYAPDPSDYVDF